MHDADGRPRLTAAGLAQQLLPLRLTSTLLAYAYDVALMKPQPSDEDIAPQLQTVHPEAVLVLTRTHLLVVNTNMQILTEVPLQGDLTHDCYCSTPAKASSCIACKALHVSCFAVQHNLNGMGMHTH